MKRYAICPIAPGCLWWNGLGYNKHVNHLLEPVKEFAGLGPARKYARKHANDYNNGLAIVDTNKDLVDWGGSYAAVWDDPFAASEEE